MVDQAQDVSQVFIELGVVIVGLALLARFANRLGFSAIPLYLLAGLAFGNGGLVPLNVSENFTQIGAEIGVLLLLLGLNTPERISRRISGLGFLPGWPTLP
jgi:CPA2 family monovalent cation:H+ antiporter-2